MSHPSSQSDYLSKAQAQILRKESMSEEFSSNASDASSVATSLSSDSSSDVSSNSSKSLNYSKQIQGNKMIGNIESSSKIHSNVTSNTMVNQESNMSGNFVSRNGLSTKIPVSDLVPVLQLQTVSLYIDSTLIAYISLNNRNSQVNLMNQEFVRDLNECLDWLESGILLTEEGRKSEVIDTSASMSDQLKQYKELKKKRKNGANSGGSGIVIDDRYKRIQCVVVVTEKDTFMVGADIFGLYQITDAKLAQQVSREGQRTYQRLSLLKIPTIAALSGSALGGGLELAMACRYRWCVNNSRVELGLPEVQLGVLPGAGGCYRLPHLIGLEESMKIILAGGSVRPEKALKLGVVDELFEGEDRYEGDHRFFNSVRNRVIKFVDGGKLPPPRYYNGKWLEEFWIGRWLMKRTARQNLDKLTRGNYPATYAALDVIMNGYKANIDEALKYEAQHFGELAASQVSKNLMSIFFLRENSKKIKTYIKSNVKPRPVNKVAIVGAGVMGSGIGVLFANKRMPVYLKDIKDEFVKKGLEHVSGHFNGLVQRKRSTPEAAQEKINLVTGGTGYDGVKTCEVIIEAAVENMKLKKSILQDCENNTPEDTIFSTNTSTLSITELATVSKRPDKVVGFHFFNPAEKMPLVEIIRGEKTSDETVATMYDIALKLGKIPIVVNDGPGFLVNRILGIYLLESMRMVQEKYNIEQIDNALLDFGMPMGPARLFDEVGIDVAAHSGDTLEVLGERFHKDEKGKESMKKMLEAGFLGKKTGKGFFIYKDGKSQGINPKLKKFIGYDPSRAQNVKKNTVINRCVLLMINEAAYILDENIAKDPETVDTGMIFGTGFAPFRGGLLSYADSLGVAEVVKRLSKLEKKHGARFKPAPLLIRMAANGKKFFPNRVVIKSSNLNSKL